MREEPPKQLSVELKGDFARHRFSEFLLWSAERVLPAHRWKRGRKVARLAAMMPRAPSIIVQINGFIERE